MTLNDVLLSLLEQLGAADEAHLVSWDTVQRWPVGALDRMLETGILAVTTPAQTVECRGCENHCFMEVRHLPVEGKRPVRAFVVCGDPEMQEQMGLIPIPSERLQQWKATALQLAKVVAVLLAIESKVEDRHGQTNIRIGMIKGKEGRRWLSLNKSPLALEVNDHRLPLEEVLFFEQDRLAIDRGRIDQKTTVNIEGLEIGSAEWRSQIAHNAANARHDQPGGSRDKQQQIRGIWATGKYTSRDRCAEEECAALDMSYSTARKALRNTPDPTPST